MEFLDVKAGDEIIRVLESGGVPLKMKVHSVDDNYIYIEPPDVGWKFRRDNGAEVDEYLGWDGIIMTGSYLKKV